VSRKKFMLGFGIALAVAASVGLSYIGLPLWFVCVGGALAGTAGTLLAPRSKKTLAAQRETLALKAQADAIQDADWQLQASHEKLGF